MGNPSTTQLGAPLASTHQMGRFTLNRIVRCEAAAAAPVAWTELSNIVAIEIGEPSWDYEADILHQGGGDEKKHIRRGPRYEGTITVLSGKVGDVVGSILGVTWGASHVAMSLRMDKDDPQVIWEAICRDSDNTDHLFSLVIQDLILDDVGMANALDYSARTIPFHNYHEPFLLYDGYKLVYDVKNATPSTVAYTLSGGTPATLLVATDHDDWFFNNLVYVKVKDNSAGDTIGKRRTSGVSATGATLTFTTGTPAASDVVYILYADVA